VDEDRSDRTSLSQMEVLRNSLIPSLTIAFAFALPHLKLLAPKVEKLMDLDDDETVLDLATPPRR